MMQCTIMSAIPIPLQIGVILNIVTMPPLIFWPKTIWSHSKGMPNMKERIRNWTRKFAGSECNRINLNQFFAERFIELPPKWTENIANREILNNPSVQNTEQIGRLRECGQEVFDSSAPSSASPSLLFNATNRGRTSVSVMASATELDPVLDAIETGLEFRDDANELGSDGKHLDLWMLVFWDSWISWTGALAGLLSCWWWWAMIR